MADQEKTFLEVFARQVRERGDSEAIMYKPTLDAEWKTLSWNQFNEGVRAWGRGLLAAGFDPKQVISVLSNNRPEWAFADLGTIMAGGICTGIYQTNSAEQCEYILNHSENRYIFCDYKDQVQKILSIKRENLPHLEGIICLEGEVPGDDRVISYEKFIAAGNAKKAELDKELDARAAAVQPEDTMILVYTSGTTGPPKAVQLSHDNILPAIQTAIETLPSYDHYRCISYLPTAHVADRVGHLLLPIVQGSVIGYVEKVEEMMDAMAAVRPTQMVWVPRIYEKFRAKVSAGLADAPAIKRKLFKFALDTGYATMPYRLEQKPIPFPLSVKHALANKLIYSKIKERLGGELRYFLSGAAPLPKELAEWFFALNIQILNTWSLSETSAIATYNIPSACRFGSVGKPAEGVEVKIDEDGEILLRGKNVMRGYYKNDEANKAAFTEDGFFRTGDIGHFDEDGYLYITDRKKDLIITSSGKNIAPQIVEGHLKEIPLVSLAIVHGNDRNYLTALLTLDEEELAPWAEANGKAGKSMAELAEDPALLEFMTQEVERINAKLARVEQIKKFKILPRDFTVEDDEITPTLKLKRREINQKYKDVFDEFYV